MANFAPDVDLNGAGDGNDTSIGYAENDPATAVAPEATAGDANSADLDLGSLTVAFTAGGTADDQLRILSGDFAVEETDLYYQGVPVGTVTGGTDGSTPLVATFAAGATPAVAEALIRAIAFVNFSAVPVPGDRTITFTLADGDGGTSTPRVATISVSAADTPPLAQDDMIAASENAVATGSLFADNGNGADSDPDGALTILAVEGSEGNVGVPIVLESGALLTVNEDGSYSYDPNGKFAALTGESSGAVNISTLADTFSYTLAGGNMATVTVTVNGIAGPGDRLTGDDLENQITGTRGADLFLLGQGGVDRVSGSAGDDIFYFGGALTAYDMVLGGSGHDTLLLQGDTGLLVLDEDVRSIEAISMLAGNNMAFGDSGADLHDYWIQTHDDNFAAGTRVRINGSALLAGESLTFHGARETDASFLIYGGYGADRLEGGDGDDIFFFDIGRFAFGDTVDGSAGYDGLFLRGNYTIDFTTQRYADRLGVENLTLISGSDERYARGGGSEFDYSLVLANGNVVEGATLTVSGAMLQAGETLLFDGSRARDGALRIFGGAAADRLTGGEQGDLLHGNLGADFLTGGLGSDAFRYQSAAESTMAAPDWITDFIPEEDRIELDRIDADIFAEGNQAFRWIGSDAFGAAGAASAGELRVVGLGGDWVVEGDTDGDGKADLVIDVSLLGSMPLGVEHFLL